MLFLVDLSISFLFQMKNFLFKNIYRHKEKHNKDHAGEQAKPTSSGNPDEEQLKKALEEEAALMNQLKVIILYILNLVLICNC